MRLSFFFLFFFFLTRDTSSSHPALLKKADCSNIPQEVTSATNFESIKPLLPYKSPKTPPPPPHTHTHIHTRTLTFLLLDLLAGATTNIIFVATKHVFCRDKMTNIFCRDKMFVATNIWFVQCIYIHENMDNQNH